MFLPLPLHHQQVNLYDFREMEMRVHKTYIYLGWRVYFHYKVKRSLLHNNLIILFLFLISIF